MGFGVEFAWDVPLTEGYEYEYLSLDKRVSNTRQVGLSLLALRRRLTEFNPDFALLNGYTPYAFYIKALLALKSLNIPILIRAEATDEAVQRGTVKGLMRNAALRLLYSQVAYCFAIGHNAQRHYLSKGLPASKLGWSPYCVDSDFIEKQVEQWLPLRAETRLELGFADSDIVFMFSGKLIEAKEPLILASGLRQLTKSHQISVGLIVMGDGPLRQQLESEICSIHQIKSVFAGFQNQSRIGKYYSAADCLILPSKSSETWGLVVNEALMFGVPAIVSDRVGCRHDLIIEGETGFVFAVGNGDALADRMRQAAKWIRQRRLSIAIACRRRVKDYSIEKAAEGIREFIKCR